MDHADFAKEKFLLEHFVLWPSSFINVPKMWVLRKTKKKSQQDILNETYEKSQKCMNLIAFNTF